MPMYDFICKKCSLEFDGIAKVDDRHKRRCPKCGGFTEIKLNVGRYIPFKSGIYEHIAKEPMHIDSKKELKEACRKHNVTSLYLEDS